MTIEHLIDFELVVYGGYIIFIQEEFFYKYFDGLTPNLSLNCFEK